MEANLKLSRNYYQAVHKLRPNDKYALFALAKLEKNLGNLKSNYNYLKHNLMNNPKDIQTLFEVGTLEFHFGNIEEAKSCYRKILNIRPDSLAYFELAMTYEYFEEMEKAAKCNNEYKWSQKYGQFEKNHGDSNKALAYFNHFIGTKYEPIALYKILSIHLKNNNLVEALYYLLKLQNNNAIDTTTRIDCDRLEDYLKYKMGILTLREDNDYYYTRQLINYDEKEAIRISQKYFLDNIDLNEVLPRIKEEIKEENFSNSIAGTDFYKISLDHPVGEVDGETTNSIYVTTILNTDKILLLRPYSKHDINTESENMDKLVRRRN